MSTDKFEAEIVAIKRSMWLQAGCEVFTTVGSQEKRDTLKRIFPALKNDHFANSRDLTFERHFFQVTKGKGQREITRFFFFII